MCVVAGACLGCEVSFTASLHERLNERVAMIQLVWFPLPALISLFLMRI